MLDRTTGDVGGTSDRPDVSCVCKDDIYKLFLVKSVRRHLVMLTANLTHLCSLITTKKFSLTTITARMESGGIDVNAFANLDACLLNEKYNKSSKRKPENPSSNQVFTFPLRSCQN